MGAPARYRGAGTSRDHDQRLDAVSAAYMTAANSNGNWNNVVWRTTDYLSITAYNDVHGSAAYRFQWEYDNVFPGSYASDC